VLLSAWAVEGAPEIPALLVFVGFAAALGWLALRMYAVPRGAMIAEPGNDHTTSVERCDTLDDA
jgi:hypothetical protein